MINGEISSDFGGVLWLGAGIGLALWTGLRSRRAGRLLREAGKEWPTHQRDWLSLRLVIEAFMAGGAWLGLFLMLDWIW
jgi:hypothetical protein